MTLTKSNLRYLEGVRAQIAALSAKQDKLFSAAQKTLSPRFNERRLEDYLFDYLFNGGELSRD